MKKFKAEMITAFRNYHLIKYLSLEPRILSTERRMNLTHVGILDGLK